jgi:glutaredoxin
MTIRMMGAMWCGDTVRARNYFDEHGVTYEWLDVETDEVANAEATERCGGNRRIPVIVFDDGTVFIEPTNAELGAQLGH